MNKLTLQLLFDKLIHIDRGYLVQKLDVLIRVELCHLPFGGRLCTLLQVDDEVSAPQKVVGTRVLRYRT